MEGGAASVSGRGPPFHAIPSGEQTVWADASPLIRAACDELQEGELIHGENFSLFAAMSALEIMDPKMDSGMEKCGYHSLEEAIENGAAPIPFSSDKTLDIEHLIDLMDHLLACEATWHKGHSLAQTVFSCIYLLQIERTSSHALLHSYCRIIQATCNLLVSAVSDARTHEEEDLFTMSYGLPLKGDGDDKCLSILNAVEEALCRQLRACKAPIYKKHLTEDNEALQPSGEIEEGYYVALLCRLRFRKYFYHALMCMRRPQGRGLELARKHVASCISELASIDKSLKFLRSNAHGTNQLQGDDECGTTASGRHPIGFAPGLNSKLLAPAPPRAIKLLSWKEAIKYFEKLLHDLDNICTFPLDSSLEHAMHSVVRFQNSEPDLVARANLQLLLIHDGKLYGRDPFYDLIIKALPMPEALRNQELRKQLQKDELMIQLGQLVGNLLKVLCTNTAWQQRKLGRILQDWGVIAIQLDLASRMESGTIDESLYMKVLKHIFAWVEEQTYWIASRFLMLGFELDLYSPGEYCMVYWYMYVIFIKLLEKVQRRTPSHNENFRRRGKKKRESSKDGVEFSPAMLLLQCYICLSEGLAMMLAGLCNACESYRMPSIFNTEQELFIQRFELLQKARVPEGVTYHLFKESIAHANISSIVKYPYFADAQRIAMALRGRFSDDPEKLEELRQIEQVAEHNRIALNVINQVGASEPSLRVTFEFSCHPYFAVAVVKRS